MWYINPSFSCEGVIRSLQAASQINHINADISQDSLQGKKKLTEQTIVEK